MSELLDWLKPSKESPGTPWSQAVTTAGEWQDVAFDTESGPVAGKLFIPRNLPAKPPLLVLLHGCGQSADEFATATRMAEHAEVAGFLAFFPVQCTLRNAGRCWNWFVPDHQRRGAGEPALIAHAVREIASAHDVDRRRIYVGGLSAGGAMAVIMGRVYPDLFAAVGVHSGVAYGVAVDAASALDTMRRGPEPRSEKVIGPRAPTIVFHGDADNTVHQSNGKRIIEHCVGDTSDGCRARQFEGDGREYVQTVFTGARGQVCAEHWEISEGGHAWSGGQAGASFSDPSGPDASEEMLRFFGSQRLRPRVATVDGGQSN